eukprot:gene18726-25257_t
MLLRLLLRIPPRKKASRKRTETGDGEAPADDAEARDDKQRAVVVEVIGECLTELQDDFIPLDELQARLRDRKLVIADSVLAEFLTFCQENYDSKEWRTKVPPIVYDKDEKNFVGV